MAVEFIGCDALAKRAHGHVTSLRGQGRRQIDCHRPPGGLGNEPASRDFLPVSRAILIAKADWALLTSTSRDGRLIAGRFGRT
jgi:hypothetical protein